MKKISVLLAALFIVALVGCGSSPASQTASASTVPDWMEEIAPEDVFWGIGFAKLQNESLAMETATTRAQRDIARQISASVQGLLTDYARESGLQNNSRSIQSIENIGRNLVNANLSGASVNKRTKMPDGTWYVRASIKKADAQRTINSIVNHEMADFAEWKSDQALRMLDSELAKTQSRPVPRGED